MIDHNIDVRYAPDLETAFNRFIEKWCGEYYSHLIDSDDNDGQFIRDRIAEMKKCQGCGKSNNYCGECERLLQT